MFLALQFIWLVRSSESDLSRLAFLVNRSDRRLVKLYFGNLPRDIDNEQLQDLVRPFGEPDSAAVIMDRDTGQSRGFAFVEWSNSGEARAAMQALNGKEVGGRTLVVNEARPNKGGGGGRTGYSGRRW